ncbi:hypothetical protein [Coxiella burnetii]|nr:hypothetical protein [Coxiella burnetii]
MSNPIAFDEDTEQRAYDKNLATTWWRILLSSYRNATLSRSIRR